MDGVDIEKDGGGGGGIYFSELVIGEGDVNDLKWVGKISKKTEFAFLPIPII